MILMIQIENLDIFYLILFRPTDSNLNNLLNIHSFPSSTRLILLTIFFPRHNKSFKHYATAGSMRDQQQSVFRVRLSDRLLHTHDRHGSHLRSDGAAAQAKSSFHRGTSWTRSISKAGRQILLDEGLLHRHFDRGNRHPFVIAIHVEDFRRCRKRQVNTINNIDKTNQIIACLNLRLKFSLSITGGNRGN